MELRRVAILDHIDRLTNDPLSDHSRDVQRLKSEYNRIVNSIRNDISAASRDILDIFPPEVWIQIVKGALPVDGYGAALLLLTMVSNKWMQTLTLVPTLWAYIELRGSQEDSLAMVEAFRELSRDAPVHLLIYLPTRYDHSTICAILANTGPRIREVTIAFDIDTGFHDEEACAVLQLLLNGSQFNSSLTYIHWNHWTYSRLYQASTAELLKNNPVPPSLCGIRHWSFEWRDFQTKTRYLERLEVIESCSPIERVLSHRIQLPNLRSLSILGFSPEETFKPEDEEGFPPLQNLMSLTYNRAYREVLMRLLLSVAPQLVYLNLWVPRTTIPRLAAVLPVAINLKTLMLTVESGRGEDDGQENERIVCPVYQHIAGEIHGLRLLDIDLVSDDKSLTPEQAERRNSFLSFLMSTISGLYTKVGSLRLAMTTNYLIAFDVVLSYVQSLTELRTLQLDWPDGYFPDTEDTYTLEELEYLDTRNIDVSHCFRTPNLLYLGFTWGCHRNLDTLTYTSLRKLVIDAPRSAVVELPASGFPSLQELNVRFRYNDHEYDDIHGSFKLTSFPFLKSIALVSDRYQPQGTMLCFALLSHPRTCPSLSEIKFRGCFPDWDILFLMLERRNFMVDSTVSLIRRITIPRIPTELCAPLSSLLGGIYAKRPPNNDLFMGGARELLLDDKVSECTDCLLGMMGGCTQDDQPYWAMVYDSIKVIRFAWAEIPECGGPATLDWMSQRKALLEEFLLNLATWKKHYRRRVRCARKATEMEVTEYGVIASDGSW